tara:strand:+ start:1135 stop:1293 length:159 start_codon:yes stop_codon:yes gene_type:complete
MRKLDLPMMRPGDLPGRESRKDSLFSVTGKLPGKVVSGGHGIPQERQVFIVL